MRDKIFIFILLILSSCIESTEVKVQRFLIKGNEALQKQDIQQAQYYFSEAVKLDSCFADALNNLGTLFYNQQRYSKALDYYNQTLSCKPKWQRALFNRANTYYELKEYYNALQDLNEVAKVNPDTFALHFTRGLVYAKVKDFRKAEQAFILSLKKNNKSAEAKVNLASVYYYQNKLNEADQLIEEGILIVGVG